MKLKWLFFSFLFSPSFVLSETSLPKFNFENMKIKKYEWEKETKHDAFCNKLLSSFKSKNVLFLKPKIIAKSIGNKTLVEKFRKCDLSELVTQYTFEPRVWEAFKNLPERERNQYGKKYVKKGPFKLFEANIYGVGEISSIIYGSCNMDVKRDKKCVGNYTNFSVIDIKTCKVKNNLQTRDENYSQGDVTVGVLNFENKDYFYESNDLPNESEKYLYVYYWNFVKRRNRGFFQKKCIFTESKYPNTP